MNKTLLLTAVLLLYVMSAIAQNTSSPKKELLSYNFSLSDYELPGLIKDSSASKAFNSNNWYKAGRMSFGFGVSYWRGLTDKIDASGSFTGTFSNFPANFVKDDSVGQAGFSSQLDALLHMRALKETAPVNPFLTAGLGIGYFSKNIAAYAPLGMGLQFRFKQGAYLFTQAQWRLKIIGGITHDYLHYSVGFAQNNPFARKKKPEVFPVEIPVEPVLPPDSDGDGFADANDKCPDVKGTLNGCPDTDADGVADKEDACPTEKGTLKGCPDADNDGVADKDDQCKDVAGLARYNGCPIPDSDKDGVNDEEDKCPNEAGVLANNGCPEIKQEVKQKIEFAAKNIFFQFASDVILKKSYAALNQVVTVLQQNPSLKLSIAAHADNLGTPERNMMWSERRAKAVADYFISKGIAADRITYKGYGDTQPVASNKTEAGRAANRRVEMKVDY